MENKEHEVQLSEKVPISSDTLHIQILPRIPTADNEKAMLANNGETPKPTIQGQGSPYRQYVAACVAQLGTLVTGLGFGFTATAIPKMVEGVGGIQVDDNKKELIAGMYAVGTPIGCLLSGYMMDAVGRRKTLIITEIPAILGFLLIAFASGNINMIYAGRFFVGLGSGMVGAPSRVYTGELSQPHLRGTMTALASVGVSLGVLLSYGIGAIFDWDKGSGFSTIVPLLSLLLILFYPESPSYLVSHNKPEMARKALKRFRESNYNLDGEIDALTTFATNTNVKKPKGFIETVNALKQPKVLKPYIILFIYFGIYQWSGTNTFTFYAGDVFKSFQIPVELIDNLIVILGVVRVIATIVACVLCRKVGRRTLTMVSSIGCGISMLALGIWMWKLSEWKSEKVEPSATWFPVCCVFVYTIICTMGFLVVPWVMIGEVYPVQVRGIIGGLTTMTSHLFVLSVVRTYYTLNPILTSHGTYFLYGTISLVGTIYFYFYLPETQGKTLQEIEDYFSGKNNNLKTGSISCGGKAPKVEKGQVLL